MERTRSAILSAAAATLARDRAATLPQIATAAGVGRTTVHRYFPDRDTLIKAAVEDSVQAIGEAIAEARLSEGTPLEALHRLVMAYLSVGDKLVFLFNDPHVMRDYGVGESDGPPEADPVMDLIERGQRDGVFDDQLTASWIQHVLWALVYTGIDEVDKGSVSRHGVAATVIRTLERGILR
nr:TetR/AcrR family transcriptional regulator [Kibdelosporangium sp. MJ126-NF4]CEL21361.1 transcriptional regulator, TetR family [Kibdelosporangium sp. MJ126-NF4]CTQ96072.1 transcriptional regulator, TetR family [Kibdelosporangium sp. MJ126-NF4]